MTAILAYFASFVCRRFGISSRTHVQDIYPVAIQPFVKHRTLSYEEFENRDLLIVGDVHGCYDEAMKLMDNVREKHGENFVTIFVGDMVNKGPKNVEMLDFIMNSKDVHCIRGNHEQAVLGTALKKRHGLNIDPRWANSWATKLSEKQFSFLANLPYTISVPILNIQVVHGGINPKLPLYLQNDYDMLHMRGLKWTEDNFHGQVLVPTSKQDDGYMWATCWQGPQHIYFGHDAIKRLQLEKYCTGLDTGCLYGGKLTAVYMKVPRDITGPIEHSDLVKEFFAVDAYKAYVPVN